MSGGCVTGVIDFSDVSFGDPDYDFSSLLIHVGDDSTIGVARHKLRYFDIADQIDGPERRQSGPPRTAGGAWQRLGRCLTSSFQPSTRAGLRARCRRGSVDAPSWGAAGRDRCATRPPVEKPNRSIFVSPSASTKRRSSETFSKASSASAFCNRVVNRRFSCSSVLSCGSRAVALRSRVFGANPAARCWRHVTGWRSTAPPSAGAPRARRVAYRRPPAGESRAYRPSRTAAAHGWPGPRSRRAGTSSVSIVGDTPLRLPRSTGPASCASGHQCSDTSPPSTLVTSEVSEVSQLSLAGRGRPTGPVRWGGGQCQRRR